jgi:hypothetical protein
VPVTLAAARARIPVPDPSAATAHDEAVRGRLSAHLAGLALVPTVTALAEHGVLRLMRHATEVSVDSLAPRTQMAPARLRVALRLLAACGWLEERCAAGGRDCFYAVTPAGQVACDAAPPVFREAAAGLAAIVELPQAFGAELDDTVVGAVRDLARLAAGVAPAPESDPAAARLVREPLGGITVVAAVVTLAHSGMLELLAQGPLRLLEIDDLLQVLFERLESEDWLTRTGSDLRLTPAGERAVLMAPACTEVWSYLPLLLSTSSSGSSHVESAVVAVVPGSPEEVLNVSGRGASFRPWSEPLDALIVDLFNRPMSQQPRGISDVACGSGALLGHVYTVIRERTSRGRVLKEHPLLVLGADHSRLAREMTARAMRSANVPRFHVTAAAAGDPSAIAGDAARHHISLRDLLHLRAFVAADADADALEPSLAPWLPYAGRFGIAVLERHPGPIGSDREIDRVAAAAYDAVFGHASRALSDADALAEAARRAGLDRHPLFRAQFPQSAAPAVSFGYFTAAGRTHA